MDVNPASVAVNAPIVKGALNVCISEIRSNKELEDGFRGDDWNLLQFAAASDDVEAVETILATGIDTDSACVLARMTALHIAARFGHIDIIKALHNSQNPCNLNAQDQFGFTALHYAVISKQKEAVKVLLNLGCSPDIASSNKTTALDVAKSLNDGKITELLTASTTDDDENYTKLKGWLQRLKAERYLPFFIDEGYNYDDLKKSPPDDGELDRLGIEELGIRRQMKNIHLMNEDDEEGDEEEEDDDDDDDDEEEEEDD